MPTAVTAFLRGTRRSRNDRHLTSEDAPTAGGFGETACGDGERPARSPPAVVGIHSPAASSSPLTQGRANRANAPTTCLESFTRRSCVDPSKSRKGTPRCARRGRPSGLASPATVGVELPNEQPEAEEQGRPNAEAEHERQKQGAFDALIGMLFLVAVALTQSLWLGLLVYFVCRLSI